jgi:hypothetical protein
MSDKNRSFWEKSLDVARNEISDLNSQIEDELAQAKQRLTELQTAKRASLQVYDAACIRLGLPNDLAKAESQPVEIG